MNSSKKSSPRSDASQNKKPSFFSSIMMKWFKKSTAVTGDSPESSPLQTEANVVPKTEITASRQALNNINLALSGESSGESSGIHKSDKKGGCKNKYCCDVSCEKVFESVDKCDDESIKDNKNSNSKLIENLRSADNSTRADNETDRRPCNDKNCDCIIVPLDYNRIECPDYPFPSIPVNRDVKYRRFYVNNCHLFLLDDKARKEDDVKTPLNYQFLSNLEKRLDETKFNLLKCKAYNANWRRLKEKAGIEQIEFEDFRDNDENFEMSDDTRAIKEFYNLSVDENILVHFLDITVETGCNVENYSKSCFNFIKWLLLKGKEIKEKHLVKKSWIKVIMKFFTELSK